MPLPADIDDLIAAYQTGANTSRLAADFGLHCTTVAAHLDRHQIPRHHERTNEGDDTVNSSWPRSAPPLMAELKVRAYTAQTERLREWAAPFGDRVWAIESARGLGYLLAQQLVATGETVVDVPAMLSTRAPPVGVGTRPEERPQRCSLGRDRCSAQPRPASGRS